MMDSRTSTYAAGSNRGALRWLLTLVLGAVLAGGVWSALGSRSGLIGTWELHEGSAFDMFRFDGDGSYWHRTHGGLISFRLDGRYEVLSSSKGTFRVRITTPISASETDFRLEGADRLLRLDPESPGDPDRYTRAGDWVQAVRPSPSPPDYRGARPHLGCWRKERSGDPAVELLEDGTLIRHRGRQPGRASYSVDFSAIPFEIDITDSEGEVDREIFDFAGGGSMRISQTHLADGARPTEMSRFQTYFPCAGPENLGDTNDH